MFSFFPNPFFILTQNCLISVSGFRLVLQNGKKEYPEYLSGNDNRIGIIGEYWAKIFLETLYENIDIMNMAIKDKSNKWVDFELKHIDTTESISVKTIFEDKNGTSGPIKLKDKPDSGVCSIIVIKLNNGLFPSQILYIKDISYIPTLNLMIKHI